MIENESKEIIGYQITDSNGYNIHGNAEDPFDLSSFEILIGGAVTTAKEWASETNFQVIEVRQGEIERPEFVSTITYRSITSPRI